MFRIIVLGASMMFASSAVAKDPCKKVDSKENAFTGEIERTFKASWWEMTSSKGELSFALRIVRTGVHDEVLPVGYPFELRLADGSQLSLLTADQTLPVAKASSNSVSTTWNVVFEVTDEVVAGIKASPLAAIRFEIANEETTWGMADGPFAAKFGSNFGDAVTCLAP